MRLLNDEEIYSIQQGNSVAMPNFYPERAIAEAQHQLDLRDVVELIDSEVVRLLSRKEELDKQREPLIVTDREWTIEEDMFMQDSIQEIVRSHYIIAELQSLKDKCLTACVMILNKEE